MEHFFRLGDVVLVKDLDCLRNEGIVVHEAEDEPAPLCPQEGTAGAEGPPPHHSGAYERLRAPCDPRHLAGYGPHHYLLRWHRAQPPCCH